MTEDEDEDEALRQEVKRALAYVFGGGAVVPPEISMLISSVIIDLRRIANAVEEIATRD